MLSGWYIWDFNGGFTHTMPFPCCSPAVPLPCRSAKALGCVFPIWFTQCGYVWFTHVMPFPRRSHAVPMPFPAMTWMFFWKRPLKAMAGSLHGGGGRVMAYWPQVSDLPAYDPCCSHAQFQTVCYQQHTDLRLQWPVWNRASFVID
jgi:hypothetical protein